jgi:rubrerythrin
MRHERIKIPYPVLTRSVPDGMGHHSNDGHIKARLQFNKRRIKAMKITTVEREKYSESELESIACDVYDETVTVLGMEFDALRIVKELDEVYYSQLLEGLQEYEDKYICPICESEYDDEDEARECNQYPNGFSHESVVELEGAEDEQPEEDGTCFIGDEDR